MHLDLTAILTALYIGYPCPPHYSSAVYGPEVSGARRLFPYLLPTGPRMLEDGYVPGTYTALCPSRKRLETLVAQLNKKSSALKHMKLEIRSIKVKHYH